VFDRRRVHPSGLACELVVQAEDAGISRDALHGQFARRPHAVSFAAGSRVLTLVTLHVTYGSGPQDRVVERTEIAEWLARWATAGDPCGTNLVALDDFNIDRRDDPWIRRSPRLGSRHPTR
jgi:hypothetical protein